MITRQLDGKGYCGSGFFTTPLRKLNPFHPYCQTHDLAYYISQQEYAKSTIENDDKLKVTSLERKIVADIAFYKGCRSRARNSWLISRPVMVLWAESYIKAVKMFSEEVWWKGAKETIAKFKQLKDNNIELLVIGRSNKIVDLATELSELD